MRSQTVMVVSSVRTGLLHLRSNLFQEREETTESQSPHLFLNGLCQHTQCPRQMGERARSQALSLKWPWYGAVKVSSPGPVLCVLRQPSGRPLSLQHRTPGRPLFSHGYKQASQLLIRPWICQSEWKEKNQQTHWPRHLTVRQCPT